MRHQATTVAAMLTVGLAVVGCSTSSHSDPKPTSTTPATVAASTRPSARSGAVKLSTTWVPKLEALSKGTGISDCSTDSGSDGCVTAIGEAVNLFGSITHAIGAANAGTEYPKTIAEITKLVDAADTYDKDGCGGDPNADVDGSPCPKNAIDVSVGVMSLQFVMKTDEANAGVL